jgi:hypothetical protein
MFYEYVLHNLEKRGSPYQKCYCKHRHKYADLETSVGEFN